MNTVPLSKISTAIFSLLLVLALTPGLAHAQCDMFLIDPEHGISAEEYTQIEQELKDISAEYNCNVCIVSLNKEQSLPAQEAADALYKANELGENGILLYVNSYSRDWAITTHGLAIDAFTEDGQKYIRDQVLPLFSKGEYAQAYKAFATLSSDFLKQAKTGKPYDKGNLPKPPMGVPVHWILIDVVVAIGAAYAIAVHRRSSLKSVKAKTDAQEYLVEGSFNLLRKKDTFLETKTTSRHIERNSSQVHTDSSGDTFGGSSGKF